MADILQVSEMVPNNFEAKRKFRWILNIAGIDAYLLKTASRPKYNSEEATINWINSTRYLAGKYTFEPMAMTLHDPIAPSGAQQVMEWVRTCHEHLSQRAGYADFYKRDIQLKMLDPFGAVVELWDVKGAWCQSVDYGDLDYGNNDLAEISLTVRYDVAVLQY